VLGKRPKLRAFVLAGVPGDHLAGTQEFQSAFFRPRPPALPAFRAISLRSSGVSFRFLAAAPFRPNATAAGFFFFATQN
jgi:hypothetical protein